MRIVIKRLFETKKEVLGELDVFNNEGVLVFTCNTLELPYKHNKNNISCIPTGCYDVVKYQSPSKGPVLLIAGVPGRLFIEIHIGNYYTNTEGCILVGKSISYDINGDGQKDVNSSAVTMEKLLKLIKEPAQLTINDYIC